MRFFAIGAAILISIVSLTNADLTGYQCAPDGDHVIDLQANTQVDWTGPGAEATVTMQCVQQVFQGVVAGHVQGDFYTNGTDPTVTLMQDITNETTFAWTGYQFYIAMSQNFSIINIYSMPGFAPAGWTAAITQPSGPQTMPNGGTGWMGLVSFSMGSGSPVEINSEGTFAVKFNWTPVQGNPNATFCTEQIPTPEPATMTLLALGGLFFARRK